MNDQSTLIKNIGIKLKSYRLQKGFSIKQLAEKSNVSDQTIMNLENGTSNNLSLVKLESISNALSLPIHFFITEKSMYLEDTSSIVNIFNAFIKDGIISLDTKNNKPIIVFNDRYLYNYYKFYIENIGLL